MKQESILLPASRKLLNFSLRDKRFCFRTQFKDYCNAAEIVVGTNEVRFLVHKDLFSAQSSFFAAALNGNFTEAAKQTVTLPDVDPKHFEHVVLWLYRQTLEEDVFFFKDGKPTYFMLLDLYALADRLVIEGMRNALVDRMAELAERTNSVPTPSDTYILYDSIRDNAPVRRLVLDLFAFKKTDNLVATHPDEWHPTFLRELVCKLKRPGTAALTRHDLRPWRPSGWQVTKACEVCRTVLKPMLVSHMCLSCERAFCVKCVSRSEGSGALDWSIAERECKPWLRSMCDYHEHQETQTCHH